MMRFPPFKNILPLRRLTLIALAVSAAPAFAQTDQTAPPANTQPPRTIPGLDNFSIAPATPRGFPAPIPTPTPAPAPSPTPLLSIQPLPTPAPRETPSKAARAPAPAPAASPTPIAAPPAPIAAPTPAATRSPVTSPVAMPSPETTAAPAAAPALAPSTTAHGSRSWWLLALIGLALAVAAGVVWFLRRRSSDADHREMPAEERGGGAVAPRRKVAAPSPAPAPVGPPVRPLGSDARPRLEIAFTPRRAGTSTTNVMVDYDIVVRNVGEIAAEGVRMRIDLVSAGNEHDAELQARFEVPIENPMIAPFTLAAGRSRPLRSFVQLPKDAVNVVAVKGRPMFVPIVAVDLRYRWPGGEGQTAQSFVIGIASKQSERMRPFWLDVEPRMYDAVTARPHAVGARR